ncbi:Type I transmembrane sorting receptor [Ascosphaera acerosa]|nr:Type I transmembrane sorting receptor [Ascosphaera acerosa]
MAPIASYASLLLLLTSCLTEASPIRLEKKRFSVVESVVRRSGAHQHQNQTESAALGRRRFRRGSLQPPRGATATSGKSSVEAENLNNLQYLVPATVGKTEVNLQLDTGSSDLWVYGRDNKHASKHPVYEPSEHGRRIQNASWELSYADGASAYGQVWTDTFTIGGVSMANQGIETASYASPALVNDANCDGVLGLGFSSINYAKPKQKTFFENVVDQLDQPLFTADLAHGSPGRYDFGYIDESRFDKDITYVDVDTSAGYWGFTVDEFLSGDQLVAAEMRSIADTGTTLLSMNVNVALAWATRNAGHVDAGSDLWLVNCTTKLPDIHFKIKGRTVTVPGNSGIEAQGGSCYTAVQNGGAGPNILGDIFFQSQLVVFELDKARKQPRLGFAQRKGSS